MSKTCGGMGFGGLNVVLERENAESKKKVFVKTKMHLDGFWSVWADIFTPGDDPVAKIHVEVSGPGGTMALVRSAAEAAIKALGFEIENPQ